MLDENGEAARHIPPGYELDRVRDVMHGLRLLYCKESGRVGSPTKHGNQLYVIECAEFVKIGISVSVRSRLKDLQASNPMELTLTRIYTKTEHGGSIRKAEQRLHRLFKKYHVRGEWFTREAFLEMKEFE